MRTAITVGTKHGGKESVLIAGPEVGIDSQIQEFKKLPDDKSSHDEFERVELWEADSGVSRYRTFFTSKAFQDRESSLKKQQEEFEKAQAERESEKKPKAAEPKAKSK